MHKTIGFVVIFCLIYFSTLTPILLAQLLSDGDCLGYTSFDYFRQSPGGYDSSEAMDGHLCAALCSGVSMPYAGVVLKRHCLCAYEQDQQAIEGIDKVPNELCDTSDDYVRYYKGNVIHPIVGLTIKSQSKEVSIDEDVKFDISINSGEEVEYSVDFGDGTDPTDWSTDKHYRYKYYVPGLHMIAVFARQPQHLNRRIISEVTYIRVISELLNENVNFKCPKVVEPGDPALCNLTITSGHRMDVSVDFGDESPSPLIPLPDIPVRALGVSVPKTKTKGVLYGSALKPEELLIIPLPELALNSLGAIQAVEGFGSAPGDMQVFILRKVCPEGGECLAQHITCFEPSALCVLNKGCSDNCKRFPQKKSVYNIVKKFSLTITEGHFYLKSTSSFRLSSGDILAVRSEGAQLAHRMIRPKESFDYITEQMSETLTSFSADVFKPLKDVKHLIRVIVSEPLVLTIPHEYEVSGHYSIKLMLKNSWIESPLTRESSINIQSTISKMRLTVSPPDVAVDQKVEITIQLNKGSNIKVLWDFGDGTVVNDQIPIIKSSQKFMKTHRYSQPGVYVIKVKAENLQGESSTSHILIAEHPVHKTWKITSNSPQLLPGYVNFTFSYPTDKTLPTNASAIIQFGDGKREVWPVPEGEWSGDYIIEHEYEKPGKYNVRVNMSNIVSNLIRRFQVDVLRRITGLNVSAKYLSAERGYVPGIGLKSNSFPIDRPINFTFATKTGDIEHYMIELNGKALKNTTQNITSFKSHEPGVYNFTFYAYNPIQKKSDPYILPLYLMEPIEGMEVFDISNDTVEPEIKRFIIEFEKIGTNSCLLIDYGESGSEVNAFGDDISCKQLFSDIKFNLITNISNPLEISKHYEKPRDYRMRFTIANQISTISKELTITVMEIDCKPPDLSIRNRVTNWRKGIEFWKSKPIQLFSKTIVDCNATTFVTRVWDAFRLEEENGTVVERIDLSSLDSYRKSFLYVPPFFLPDGHYKFKYSINMTSPDPHPLLPFYASAYTYVKVVRSPISAQLAEGAQSRVIRGWGQRIRFAPGVYSLDPDDEKNKNFEVKWFCRRLPDEYINNLLPDERQNFSEPLYDRTGIDEEWDDDDGGGCFGRGPGRINITGSEVEWNTTVFRRPGLTYEVVVQLIPPDRKPSWGALQMVLLKRRPPSIIVLCQTQALCYPHFPIGQKINPVRVGLEGRCRENCEGELIYQWTIFGVENSTEMFLSNASHYIVGSTEPKMALGIEFFQEYYPTFKDFFARLAVTNEDGMKGESDIFLHINQPPEQGSCTLDPLEGMALLDRFNVKCSDWIDPEDKPIEYYAFWAKNMDTGMVQYLMYGPDRYSTLILPYGNFTIGADIKDKEGAVVRVNITDISTSLPTRKMYETFMQSKSLDNADAAGDQAQMNMVTQALSSLMSVKMPRADPLTTTTTSTTTTTTTTTISSPISDEPTEKEREEAAKTRARMVKSVEAIMNVDTLNSLEQIGSALTALAGRGDGIDNEAKEVIIKLLNKTVTMASNIQVESPQQLIDFLTFAVGTMGGIVNRMTEQIISGVVLPTDRSKAWNLDYNVEVPDEDEEPDYILDSKTSINDALEKAVIQSERKAAELQIRQMIELTIKLVLSMLRNIVVGEKPIEFVAPSGLTLTIAMYPKGSLSNQTIGHGDATYVFPEVCDILANNDQCFGNETLGTLAVSWPAILESYGNSVDLLSADTKTLQLLVLNESLHILDVRNTTKSFSIIVPRKGSDSSSDGTQSLPDPTYVVPKIKWYEQMVYHQFMVEKSDSAVNIEVGPTNPDSEILLFIKHREKPMYDYYDILIPLKAIKSKMSQTFEIFLSNEIINNRTGFFYVGVVEVNRSALLMSSEAYILEEIIVNEDLSLTNYTAGASNYTLPGITRDFTTNYSMRIFTSGCYFYDYHKKIWSADGCYVDSANQMMTHCKCNHLTSFGSGFFVMPNSIDFSYVFANAGFADNVTIYLTIAITMCLYVLLLLWARREDRNDLSRIGATPLTDNESNSKYLYEITVFTGDRDSAATDSKVYFIISGDDDETEVRHFEDPNRKIFKKGANDSFVMAVPRRLGRLNYCRIWHDNSGHGKFRSWFLSFIVVKDVQTGEKFEFICNKWLAVEKDDGSVDRLLPVAGRGEATEFTHLFQQTTQKNLADGHLWFSVFMRPPRSRFTRVQRVSCCMALLYLSMLVNAMWYQRVPPKPSSGIDFGPFTLSPEQIGVGFFSNLIVFPPTFLIIFFFRKSKLRNLRPSRISEALKKQNIKHRQSSASSQRSIIGAEKTNKIGSITTITTVDSEDNQNKNSFEMICNENKTGKRLTKKKSKLMLPYWCRYIGWTLCGASIAISIFFLWAYGIQFGDEKTRKWITSLIISFFASILVTQPMKVFITAMILSTLFKSPDNDNDDSEDDEEDIEIDLLSDEEWLHSMTPVRKKDRSRVYRPPNMTVLERAKLLRLKELKMTEILKDIVSYLFFLWILTVVSYGNRDPNAFLMKQTLVKTFVDGANGGQNFMAIKNSTQLWSWSNSTLIPGLLIGDWYNGYSSYGLRGFLNDRVNRMMGYGVLRQIRIKPNTCQVEERLQAITSVCRAFSNVINEDRKSYRMGWTQESEYSYINETLPISRSGHLNPSRSKKDEWNYRKPSELDGLPFWGKLDVYSGGGYVIALKGSRDELSEKIKSLKQNKWIDGRSRAIFAEFSVYNAQVNLFGIVSMVMEFQPGGGIIPNYRVDVVRLMRYHQGFGLFIILCELTYIGFIIFFTIREFKNWRNQGKKYFKSYWNWAEIIIICLSYTAMGLYIYRIVLTNEILSVFNQTHGNGYVKLQYVTTIDEMFGYIIAFTTFIAIIKFIRILRFNKRMGILYSTLAQCSKDLKSFCIVFCTVFFAFVQMFYLLFGTQISDFSSFINSAETTFGMVTGKFDFEAISMASPVLGPLAFFVFVFIAAIVLINIFLTLIISAFESVKHDVLKQNNEYEIMDFMIRKVKAMFGLGNTTDSTAGAVDKDDGYNSIEEQLSLFPDKIDRLLHYINDTYFDGKLDVDNKSANKRLIALQNRARVTPAVTVNPNGTDRQRRRVSRGRRSQPNIAHVIQPRITVLDWMEVEDSQQKTNY